MQIRSIHWEQTIPLRHSVLWPMKPVEYCHVEGDSDALHYGAFVDEKLVCVASVYITLGEARLRKFATKLGCQGQGIGSKMLQYILESTACGDADVFWCDARESALGFYQRFGLQSYGERFYKADVSYFKMKISLSPNLKIEGQ